MWGIARGGGREATDANRMATVKGHRKRRRSNSSVIEVTAYWRGYREREREGGVGWHAVHSHTNTYSIDMRKQKQQKLKQLQKRKYQREARNVRGY